MIILSVPGVTLMYLSKSNSPFEKNYKTFSLTNRHYSSPTMSMEAVFGEKNLKKLNKGLNSLYLVP